MTRLSWFWIQYNESADTTHPCLTIPSSGKLFRQDCCPRCSGGFENLKRLDPWPKSLPSKTRQRARICGGLSSQVSGSWLARTLEIMAPSTAPRFIAKWNYGRSLAFLRLRFSRQQPRMPRICWELETGSDGSRG